MPSLSNHVSTELIKGLVMGDPGTGKTGGLTSLVKAGYKLRIWDYDNLLGSLVQYVRKDCPDLIGNIAYQTFTDKMKGSDMPITMIGNRQDVASFTDGIPTAYVKGLKQLNLWKTPEEDLGKPSEWGSDTIVVLDSLTSMANAAFRYCKAMNPMAKEPQTHYFSAQQLVMNLIYLLCGADFKVNVLLLAHVDYKDNHLDVTKGFPRSIGSAINSQIAANFNCVLLTETVGAGSNSKKVIRTNSTGIIDLKNPVSFKLPDSLPIETGMADFFKAVLG